MTLRIAMLAAGLWVSATIAGFARLMAFETTPGPAAAAPARWPGAAIPRPESAALVLIAHPKCPCTRASLRELERLLVRAPAGLATWVVVAGEGESEIAQMAAAIPGVRVLRDGDGAEARRFGALTSGQVAIYNAAGDLAYAGGITGGRGHEGDNAGRAAAAAALAAQAGSTAAPVFGCALEEEP